MGVSLSFLAIKGAAPADIHRALGVTDTGVASPADAYPIPSVRGAALPDGWYVVLLDDVLHPLIKSRAILKRLSRGCEVIACQIEEHDMYSGCFGLRDGELAWSVVHNSNEDRDHLNVTGEPPAALAEIEMRLRKEQARHQPGAAGVDYIFEIPLELAAACCGYRHDVSTPEGEPAFTILAESG